MMPITTALLGYGLGGRVFHHPLLTSNPGFRVKWITGSAYSGPESASLEQVFTDPEVELVVITTPNSTHGSLIRKALESGKHVVVDKPFCLSSAEALELIKLANTHNLVLTVFQNRRWDGDFLMVQKLIHQGRLGKVVHFESSFHRFRLGLRDSWKENQSTGGGILWDLGPHLLDQALMLFGTPKDYKADFRLTRQGAETWDDVELTLDYGPGIRVLLKAAMVRPWPGPRFIVHGTKASYVKFGLDPQEEALKAGLLPGKDWGREDPSQHGILYTRDDSGREVQEILVTESGNYPSFYDLLAQSIRFGAKPPVSPGENVEILRILENLTRDYVAGSPTAG